MVRPCSSLWRRPARTKRSPSFSSRGVRHRTPPLSPPARAGAPRGGGAASPDRGCGCPAWPVPRATSCARSTRSLSRAARCPRTAPLTRRCTTTPTTRASTKRSSRAQKPAPVTAAAPAPRGLGVLRGTAWRAAAVCASSWCRVLRRAQAPTGAPMCVERGQRRVEFVCRPGVNRGAAFCNRAIWAGDLGRCHVLLVQEGGASQP